MTVNTNEYIMEEIKSIVTKCDKILIGQNSGFKDLPIENWTLSIHSNGKEYSIDSSICPPCFAMDKLNNEKMDDSEILKDLFAEAGINIGFVDCTTKEKDIIKNKFEEELAWLKSHGHNETNKQIRDLRADYLIDSGEFMEECRAFYASFKQDPDFPLSFYTFLTTAFEKNEDLFKSIIDRFLILNKYIFTSLGILSRCRDKINEKFNEQDKMLIIGCIYYMAITEEFIMRTINNNAYSEHPLFEKIIFEKDTFLNNTDYMRDGMYMFMNYFMEGK